MAEKMKYAKLAANTAASANPPPSAASSVPSGHRPAPKSAAKPTPKRRDYSALPFWFGILMSIAWVAIVVVILTQAGETKSFGGIPLINWALGMSAIASPIALIWMVAAYMQRATDVQTATEPLRQQLAMILNENGYAEVRIRRFNQAIRDQLALLKNVTNIGQNEIGAILDHLQQEKIEISDMVGRCTINIGQAGEIVRKAQQFDRMLQEKLDSLRELDATMNSSNEGLVRRTDQVRGLLAGLLTEIEEGGQSIAAALEKSAHLGEQLGEQVRTHETSLVTAAEHAATTLAQAGGLIETQIERYTSGLTEAREETTRTTGLLARQGEIIADIMVRMPETIAKAEASLRQATDELQASEKTAIAESGKMAATLALQTGNLENVLRAFDGQVTQTDEDLTEHRKNLERMIATIGTTANRLADTVTGAMSAFDNSATTSLETFRKASETLRNEAASFAAHIGDSMNRFEGSATALQTLNRDNAAQMDEAVVRLNAFAEKLASTDARAAESGQSTEERTRAALEALQQMQEQMNGLRDSVTGLTATLQEQLGHSSEQHQQMIVRMSEAARDGVRALSESTAALNRHNTALGEQARAAEGQLREVLVNLADHAKTSEDGLKHQADAIAAILDETQARLAQSERRMENFTTGALAPVVASIERIEENTQRGLRLFGDFGTGLNDQAERMEKVASRVGDLNKEIEQASTLAAAQTEALAERLTSLQTAQHAAMTEAERRFTEMTARLNGEISQLSAQSGDMADQLQNMAARFGDQSHAMAATAESSTLKIAEAIETLGQSGGALEAQTRAMETQVRDLIGQMGDHAGESEQKLRQSTAALAALLDETHRRLAQSEQRLGRFTSQAMEPIASTIDRIDQTAQQGLEALTRYGSGLSEQVSTLRQLTDQVGTLGVGLETTATATRDSVETTLARLIGLRDMQLATTEEATRRFDDVIRRLETEMAQFGTNSTNIAESLHEAGTKLGEESQALATRAQENRTAMEAATESLQAQNRALVVQTETTEAQVRDLLQQITEETAASERSLRQQNAGLAAILDETQTRLAAAEERLGRFATQSLEPVRTALDRIDETTVQSLHILEKYGTGLDKQIEVLREMTDRVSDLGMGIEQASHGADDGIAALIRRLGDLQSAQDETVQGTQRRFAEVVERLQGDFAHLSSAATILVSRVQEASGHIGQETQNLLGATQQGSTQMQGVASTLQKEAVQTRALLQAQAAEIVADLSKAQSQFTCIADMLKQRGEDASTQLDRINQKFSDTSQAMVTAIEARAAQIEETAERTTSGTAAFSTSLGERLSLMSAGSDKLQNLAAHIDGNNARIVTQLEDLAARSAQTKGDVLAAVQQSLNSLDEASAALQSHVGKLDDGTQSAIVALQTAGTAVEEQSNHLRDLASRNDQQLRGLAAASASFTEQTTQIRTVMEQQNDRLIQQLSDTVGKLQETGSKLQQAVATALLGAEQSSTRFDDLTTHIGSRLTGGCDELRTLAERAEATLHALDANMHRHIGAMEETAQRLAAHHSDVNAMNETQKQELVALFTRISAAHADSAAAAEDVARRLHDTMDAIARNIGTFKEQSQISLGSIETAGNGVVAQTSLVTEQTRQAEQQVQAILASTETIAARALALRTQSQEDAARVTDMLAEALRQVSDSAEGFTQRTDEVTGKMTQAMGQFVTTTGAAGQALDEQASRLDAVAERTGSHLAQLGTQMHSQHQAMRATETELEQRVMKLSAIAQTAMERLAALTTGLAASEEKTGTSTTQILAQIGAVRDQIARDLQAMATEANATTQHITTASRAVAQESGALATQVDQTELRLRQAAAALHREGEHLPTTLTQHLGQIESANANLRHQASLATETLNSVAAVFNQVTATTQTTLANDSQRLSEMAERGEQALRQFGHILAEQLATLQQGNQILTDEQNRMAEQTQTTLAQMAIASDRMASLREHVETTALGFTSQIQSLDEQAVRVNDRLNESARAIAEQIEALGQTTQRTEGQILVATAGYRDQFDRLCTSLQTHVDGINEGIGLVNRQLEQASSGIKNAASDALDEIDRLAARFAQLTGSGHDQVGTRVEDLRKIAEQAAELLQGFGAAIDGQMTRLGGSIETIHRYDHQISTNLVAAIAQIDQIAGKLENTGTKAVTLSDTTIGRMNEVAELTESRLRELCAGAEDAANLVRTTGSTWHDQTQVLARGVQQARGEVIAISHAMDSLQQKADVMRGTIGSQTEQLMMSLAQLIAQLEAATDSMNYSTDPVVSQIENSLKKIG